jgi:predicted site-specific integrase-resolvase
MEGFLMKANEVLELLHITRPTLCKYVKENIIKISVLPNEDMIMTRIVFTNYSIKE